MAGRSRTTSARTEAHHEKQDNSDLIIRDYMKRAQEQVASEDDRCQSCGEVHSERQVEFIENSSVPRTRSSAATPTSS
jgi:hypothetical protein